MNTKDMIAFLDDMIHARIGIRLIAEQCISLIHASKEESEDQRQANYIGIINTQLSPARVINQCADFVTELCEFNYGEAPEFIVNGHTESTFTYVPVHLEYMLTELLKNAARATVENAKKSRKPIPPVEVSISHGSQDIGIRVRDQGGGVKPEDLNHIFEYSYTTVKNENNEDSNNIFSGITRLAMQSGVGGPMAGLGYASKS
jgi:signal transduction histidine kinase